MNYGSIKKCDIANGLGWRVTLWVSGCARHCKGCFNKDAQDPNYGNIFDQQAKSKILNELKQDYCDGVSIVGGEPLSRLSDNRKVVIDLCREIKQTFPTKTIWLYSGYTYEEIKQDVTMSPVLDYIDVLVDGEYIQDLKDSTLEFRGSRNQRVIDVKSGENIF